MVMIVTEIIIKNVKPYAHSILVDTYKEWTAEII